MKKWMSIPLLLLIFLATSCGGKKESIRIMQLRIDSMQTALNELSTEKKNTKAHLKRFDSLDFQFYNNQQWEQFNLSNHDGITVFYPDGGLSLGLPTHIDNLKQLFAYAPDTKIINHRVAFGGDDWTAVVSEIQGTFTDTMSTPDGKVHLPTNKPFKFMTCTVAHWQNGKMMDKYLFWDNHAFMKQIGIIQ